MHSPRDAVFWHVPRPVLPSLTGEVQADVAVVGGGMLGLMCAHALAAHGRKVCLLESDVCGGGASGRSSGFITPDSELELSDFVRRHGRDSARQLWEFGRAGVAAIRDAITGLGLECDYGPADSLFVATGARGARTTHKEFETQSALGYPARYYERSQMRSVLGSDQFHGAVRTGGTFGIDGYRFCQGLRDRLVDAGVRIFERSPVQRVVPGEVATATGRVRAERIVMGIDRWLPGLGLAEREIYHAQTFLAISEPLTDAEAARIFPDGPCMVWDTDLIYKYFRLTGGRRLLVGGGRLLSTYRAQEQHRPDSVGRMMSRYVSETFPGLPIRFAMAWPGQIGISKDFEPVVGEADTGIYFAGGAAGLPWAAALGRYLADKIVHGRAELDQLLSDHRKFAIGPKVQAVMGKAPAFALAHGLTKYFRR